MSFPFATNVFANAVFANAVIAAAAANNNRASLDSTAATVASSEEEPYWEDEDWIPLQKNGKQRSPNMIRNELQRYMDNTMGVTQTSMASQLGYKDPWNACQNESYWAAARFLEALRNQPKKRKSKTVTSSDGAPAAKKQKSADAKALMDRIVAFEAPEDLREDKVYDSCQEVIKKTKAFLALDGVTKADFCRALGGINANSLNPFLASKKQDKAGSIAYRRAWVFFEKKRLMQGEKKSKARIKNEKEHPNGFALEAPGRFCLYYIGSP